MKTATTQDLYCHNRACERFNRPTPVFVTKIGKPKGERYVHCYSCDQTLQNDRKATT